MNDEGTIQRASRGDERAIEALLVRYLPDLVAYVDRHGARWLRQRESAHDLAQSVCREVLVRLRDGRLEFRGEPQFRQWLFRAAVIKLVEHGRRGRAVMRDPAAEVAGETVQHIAAAAGTPSEAAILHEELARFEAAFATLSERSREVIACKWVEGLGHAAIAERLGVSESHSRVLLARALAELAQRGVGQPE